MFECLNIQGEDPSIRGTVRVLLNCKMSPFLLLTPEKPADRKDGFLYWSDWFWFLRGKWSKEHYNWNPGHSLGVSTFPCSIIKVNGKLQEPSPKDRIFEDSGHLLIQVWVTPLGEEPQPVDVLHWQQLGNHIIIPLGVSPPVSYQLWPETVENVFTLLWASTTLPKEVWSNPRPSWEFFPSVCYFLGYPNSVQKYSLGFSFSFPLKQFPVILIHC